MAIQESNKCAGFHDADCEAAMAITDNTLDALSEMDRFVRLMAIASGTAGIVAVVRAYLAGWSKRRVRRLQAADAGWAPFDEYQQPFAVSSVTDVRQISGSVRIRCRELRASDIEITPELLELDLFFFFAEQSLAGYEPARSLVAGAMPAYRSGLGLVNSSRPHAV